MALPFYVSMALGQVLANGAEVIVEAGVDTGTDILVEKLNDYLNKQFPNQSDPNSFTSQFLQSVKMQTTVMAQSRMMMSSMNIQNKMNEKIDKYKELCREKQIEATSGWKNKGLSVLTGGKLKQKTDNIINTAGSNAETKLNNIVNGQKSASQQVGAFSQGLGATKLAYDNANDQSQLILNATLLKLLSGMGYFGDKTVSP